MKPVPILPYRLLIYMVSKEISTIHDVVEQFIARYRVSNPLQWQIRNY
jgi:hypothetical protein